jgi:cytochrome P450
MYFTRKELPEMGVLQDLWRSALAVEQELEQELAEDLANLHEFVTLRFEVGMGQPRLLLPLFHHLREHHPILVLPRLTVVSRYTDVIDVLDRQDVFSVSEIYLDKMVETTGPFPLGMQDGPQYKREIGQMRAAIHPGDMEVIRASGIRSSKELVDAVLPSGSLDLVGGLSRIVPTRLVASYFGVPGPDENMLMRWMRSIFRHIFLNLGNDANVKEAADISSKEMRAYLQELIASRKKAIADGSQVPDDFVTRLIRIQMAEPDGPDDDTIRRQVGGTIVGAVDTISKATTQAIDVLLDRPAELAGAHAAAVAGDNALVARYIFEAMRFNPQNPFLLRHCRQDYVAARGTDHERTIPAGSLVLVGTISAMFDETRVDRPEEFRIDRPDDTYNFFGHGLHTCFGQQFARELIPVIAQSVLRLPNLRRAGHIQWDGAFPNRLMVAFDA